MIKKYVSFQVVVLKRFFCESFNAFYKVNVRITYFVFYNLCCNLFQEHLVDWNILGLSDYSYIILSILYFLKNRVKMWASNDK